MNIISYLFVLAFLPVTLVLWRLLRRAGSAAARAGLLAAGALFCGWASPASLLVLAAEGALSYALGRAMEKPGANKKALLWTGCILLLLPLLFFKYTGFLLSLTPLEGLFAPPAFLAPLGLSFVTFQQILYLRDCCCGEAAGVSPLDYACCLTFFATATCGPITRVGELAPQFRDPAPFSWDDLAAGLYCFSLGLGKKVLAAGCFAGAANYGFANAWVLGPGDALLTILCYTLQIYFDFSGYCDMAAGMARMMGLTLPVNFNSPYKAVSIADFWARWHITISRFFRLCVYIPLGGNRRGMAVTCRNILVIFLLSGLWHGAGWGFLIWGTLHGCAMVLERLCRGKLDLPKPLGWLLTFLFVNFAWVFFRAGSLDQALALLGGLFRGGWGLPSAALVEALPAGAVSKALWYARSVLDLGEAAGSLLTYWLPLAAVPAGLGLLALPNPLQSTEHFRPTGFKLALTAACLAGSVCFFSGVQTFIYANF